MSPSLSTRSGGLSRHPREGLTPAHFATLEKNAVSSCRPTGQLDPNPADRTDASLQIAALEYRARQGESILLYEDETILWRFALPRHGWWRRAQRYRLRTRPLRPSQITQAESLQRPAWEREHSWSRLTSGVWRSVLGAVQYGPSKVFYKIVPHCDAQELRQYLHQVLAVFRKTGKEVGMVVDRSGMQRAHKLDATCNHYQGKVRCHFFPPHCGHHRNPIAGFWRVRKAAMSAGRCFSELSQLYQRPRQVLMAHHERPIYAFHW
jgi:DDE superfamily endonuclease